MVVLRHNTSPSPEFSLVKRVLPVEVTAFILDESPKTAAAVARQKSTSKPFQVPLSSGYANPEIQPDSGDIIYVEHRSPISRASDQTENIKLIIEF